MHKRKFFKAGETNEQTEWILDSNNSDLYTAKMRKIEFAAGESRKFAMNSTEAIIVSVAGDIAYKLDGEQGVAERFDAIYVTNGDICLITALIETDILICEAAATEKYTSTFVSRKNVTPVAAGAGCHSRQVWNMVSPGGVSAERLILGYCESIVDGGWTGWPPHEHGGNLEEIYFYYDIEGPIPSVLQIVSDDMREHTETYWAKSGDVFAISGGFHPIVALPGVKMKNLWFMVAVKPEDRDFGVIRLDPSY